MKLLAISDLHLGYPSNRASLEQIPAHPDDWLILAGDVGERITDLELALDDLETGADHVRHAGRVALIGFCYGGTLGWLAACRRDFDAVVCYYGWHPVLPSCCGFPAITIFGCPPKTTPACAARIATVASSNGAASTAC